MMNKLSRQNKIVAGSIVVLGAALLGLILSGQVFAQIAVGQTVKFSCNPTPVYEGPGANFGVSEEAPQGSNATVLAGPVPGEVDASGDTGNLYRVNYQNSTTLWVAQQCLSSANGPTFNSFTASPSTIDAGESSILNWSVTGDTTCSASGGSGGWNGTVFSSNSNSYTVEPTVTTVYNLDCVNSSGGSSTDSVTVTVAGSSSEGGTCAPAPSAAGESTISKNMNQDYNVAWDTSNLQPGDTCEIFGPTGSLLSNSCNSSLPNQSQSEGLDSGTNYNYTYEIVVINGSGEVASSQATITLVPVANGAPPPGNNNNNNNNGGVPINPLSLIQQWFAQSDSSVEPASCTISANPSLVEPPQNTSKLSWSCSETINDCSINQGIGSVPAGQGTNSVNTPVLSGSSTTFTLSCPAEQISDSVNVGLFTPGVKEINP